jgi:hypothetical protein
VFQLQRWSFAGLGRHEGQESAVAQACGVGPVRLIYLCILRSCGFLPSAPRLPAWRCSRSCWSRSRTDQQTRLRLDGPRFVPVMAFAGYRPTEFRARHFTTAITVPCAGSPARWRVWPPVFSPWTGIRPFTRIRRP